MPRGCGPHTGQATGGIACDRSGSPEPFLQKMIREVLQTRLNAPVVFANDKDESVSIADFASNLFEHLGCLAARILLVHPIKHRKVDRFCIDQLDIAVPAAQPLDDEIGEPDTRAIRTVRAVKYKDAKLRHRYHTRRRGAGCAPPPVEPAGSTRCAREGAGSNGSAKYCVPCATSPSRNSMMLTA